MKTTLRASSITRTINTGLVVAALTIWSCNKPESDIRLSANPEIAKVERQARCWLPDHSILFSGRSGHYAMNAGDGGTSSDGTPRPISVSGSSESHNLRVEFFDGSGVYVGPCPLKVSEEFARSSK